MYLAKFNIVGSNILNKLGVVLVLSFVAFYVTVRIIPSLNPEQEIGGRFDLNYVIEYSEKYSKGEDSAENKIGRIEAPEVIINKIMSDEPYKRWFGYGSGILVKSSYNKLTNAGISPIDYTTFKFGVGYGTRTGFLQLLIQSGFLGVLFYSLIFLNFLIKFLFNRNLNGVNKTFHLTAIMFLVIFFIDFFTYSQSSYIFGAVPVLFAWVISLMYYSSKEILKEETIKS